MADIYHGKAFGIFEPLRADESKGALIVRGGAFALIVSRKSGQIRLDAWTRRKRSRFCCNSRSRGGHS